MNSRAQTVKTLPLICWKSQPVITTELLASVYGVEEHQIRQNFKNNTDRFIEGVHHFKITGQDLREFSLQVENFYSQISRKTRALMLWTERGTVRHAKMLGTDKAWEVQDQLEAFYFTRKAEATQPEPPRLTTKEQREPLIKAMCRLVSVSHAKGRPLTYEDAHSIINLKMGVDSVEALTLEQIPKAMTLVGELLERVVLEGEYIGKDDAPYYEPEPRISHAQRQELNHAIDRALGSAVSRDCGESGQQWVRNRLRVKLNLRHIEDMRPDQLPLALAELEWLSQDLDGYLAYRAKQREILCREIIGGGTPWTPHLAKEWMAELKQAVPPRPDWLVMREKLLGQAEDN
ncbi:ORF6N domain-containing protein [Nitrosococcus wardiae]|uniref:ORF6N domain-containing protein n=1 Tax=Nitrosococcus wardiae TaxID=1814290 RepID=A0A4P7BVG3_9GAMM|nr:ORF6N domain-containing protein [Nitrosococcus wardiae]QBQ54008.1 ORF6N domain-containing protein [Nitrosococcus wardiae]